MKKSGFLLLIVASGLALVTYLSSCGKQDVTPPYVSFLDVVGTITVDTALPRGTPFMVYVQAQRAGMNQLLTSGTISRSVNGGPDSILQQMTISTQKFVQFYSYIADSAKVEKYTFAFTQLDGLTGKDTIVVTDLPK